MNRFLNMSIFACAILVASQRTCYAGNYCQPLFDTERNTCLANYKLCTDGTDACKEYFYNCEEAGIEDYYDCERDDHANYPGPPAGITCFEFSDSGCPVPPGYVAFTPPKPYIPRLRMTRFHVEYPRLKRIES